MWDRLVHGYWDVDRKAVWQVVVRDLGPLRESVQRGPWSRQAPPNLELDPASQHLAALVHRSVRMDGTIRSSWY